MKIKNNKKNYIFIQSIKLYIIYKKINLSNLVI
jgi:hypothetical protein